LTGGHLASGCLAAHRQPDPGAAGKGRTQGWFWLNGGSFIITPTGEIAAQTLTEDDELVICPCDLDLGDYIKRTVFTFDKHRRIEHYKIITAQTGVVPAPENP
jgi:predicted amidohydrolase